MVRKIATRTEVNKSRKSRIRTFVRKVEEAPLRQVTQKAAATGPPSKAISRPSRRSCAASPAIGVTAQEHRLAESLAPGRNCDRDAGKSWGMDFGRRV